MIKTQKINDNSHEVVTKGWFREAFREGIDELAMLINKSFVGMESRMAEVESKMAKQEDLLALTERVIGLEKDMKGMHSNFDVVSGDLKDIRERLDRIEKNDMSVDVISLDLRVKKLEKKAKV